MGRFNWGNRFNIMRKPKNIERYESHYSESKLLRKLTSVARWAGEKVVYAVLLLYYVLRSDTVSMADKSKIYGALGYFILPADLLLDFIPLVGYTDDLAALMWALHTVAKNITPEVKDRARTRLKELLHNVDDDKLDKVL